MKPLLTPAEVLTHVFGTSHTLNERDIPLSTILAAEYRLLRPMLGSKLFDKLTSEEESPSPHIAALAEQLKTPLALHIVALLLPSLAAHIGSLGVVRLEGEGFEKADEATLARVVARLRHDADALLDAATDYLLAHHDQYPDYDHAANIRRRVVFGGGVVMDRGV